MLVSMSVQPVRETLLDSLARHRVFSELSPHRLIPLLEAAHCQTFDAGTMVFEQFHPASTFYLLCEGTAMQARLGRERTNSVQRTLLDWPDAALGWSGFLPPHRYGSTILATTDLTLLGWQHEDLAANFYSDPELGIRFFDIVLDSVRRQFEYLRQWRIGSSHALFDPPAADSTGARRSVVGRADSCLQRSPFFAAFDDEAISALSSIAKLESYLAGECIVHQDSPVDGILVLAAGRCSLAFETADREHLRPFRRIRDRSAVVAGLPDAEGRFHSEAGAWAETDCWIYRLPAAALRRLQYEDPEFGRAFQQRLLVRLAGLIGAVEFVQDDTSSEPEVTAVETTLANNQARLPVTSDLFKIPYLLRNQLTVGNAFAVLGRVQATGRYHERVLAAQCQELTENLAAEHAFYQAVLDICDQVSGADESLAAEEVRNLGDRLAVDAFANLDCRVSGLDKLPANGAQIIVMNHLACPEYYQLPNGYHFSFDTAFVSSLIWQRKGRSAVRVVRESPGAEFGHNIFYRRLAPITVPTLESGIQVDDPAEFAALRREAGARFGQLGKQALASGTSLLICPEGQSQEETMTPGRFHSGAFRLAADTKCPIVPIAIAGFGRRYKDGPLAAIVGDPVKVDVNRGGDDDAGTGALREWIDDFHQVFAGLIRDAQAVAAEVARFPAR